MQIVLWKDYVCLESFAVLETLCSFKPWLNWSLIESISRGLLLDSLLIPRSGATQVKPYLTVTQNCAVKGLCVLGIVCHEKTSSLSRGWINFDYFWLRTQFFFKFRPLCTKHRLQRLKWCELKLHEICTEAKRDMLSQTKVHAKLSQSAQISSECTPPRTYKKREKYR